MMMRMMTTTMMMMMMMMMTKLNRNTDNTFSRCFYSSQLKPIVNRLLTDC
jgi:hypothetical protein